MNRIHRVYWLTGVFSAQKVGLWPLGKHLVSHSKLLWSQKTSATSVKARYRK